MESLSAFEISQIVSGRLHGNPDLRVNTIVTDSRTRVSGESLLFVALTGPNHNGHQYISDMKAKGIQVFLVQEEQPSDEHLSWITVPDTLKALQDLATWQRQQFSGKVIAITGSNGKTIVKEWLAHLLSKKFRITKSPKSYNSQIGVALSVLQADPGADFHIFEAGISKPGEMARLARILHPDIGIMTNIGSAHQENFLTLQQKLDEKLQLFRSCSTLVYCSDHRLIADTIRDSRIIAPRQTVSWGTKPDNLFVVHYSHENSSHSVIDLTSEQHTEQFLLPFSDHASQENATHALVSGMILGIESQMLRSAVASLEPVEMRMQQIQGINGCTLINDYYNSDYQSLQNAIDLLWQQSPQHAKSLILSDLLQTGDSHKDMVVKIRSIISGKSFKRIIGIGPGFHSYGHSMGLLTESWPDTASFIAAINTEDFQHEAILLKGARSFEFERIKDLLEEKQHRTMLKIHMPTILNNLNQYRNLLGRNTRIMGMVKAFSYGSGSHEIARFLSHQNIDYLAVAFSDEGIKLRNAGVSTPIMVMSPDFTKPHILQHYRLEPEVFSLIGLRQLKKFLEEARIKDFPVHIKLDTGMHRLGFSERDLEELAVELAEPTLQVISVFSHLAAAGDPKEDDFTQQQIRSLQSGWNFLSEKLGYQPMKHLLNSTGIERFPEARFDMVRLGIGLYGLGTDQIPGLESPITFSSYISQIHEVKANETIGYDRLGKLNQAGKIGVVPVGYADGFDRRLGNGNWEVLIHGQRAKTVGQICMDMCMIDLSGVEAKEGDELVVVKGKAGIEKMAAVLKTIPYEIITGFSSRINRIYEFD